MNLYWEKSKSIPQKITINVIELLLLWLSYWILFKNGGAWFQNHLHIHNATENTGRRIIIFCFNIIIFIRLAYMMIFLLKRKIPLEESISVSLAFALYYIGYSLFALPKSISVDGLDYFAIVLFVTGCVLNTGGEIMRHRWKMKPENKGKIYTGGFFRYSRHINYFGDILWVTAYALITRNWFAASIPVFLFCFFAFFNAPKLDEYLRTRYGKDYDEYAQRTRMLIPFIF
jgi:protein-S-isoprenylcysteine O-methyltransferase Ste14